MTDFLFYLRRRYGWNSIKSFRPHPGPNDILLFLHQFSLKSRVFGALHTKVGEKIDLNVMFYQVEKCFSFKTRCVASTQVLGNLMKYWNAKCNISAPVSAPETLVLRLGMKAQESVELRRETVYDVVLMYLWLLASNDRAVSTHANIEEKDKHLTRECKRHSSICFGTKNERLWSTITVDFLKRKAHLLVI